MINTDKSSDTGRYWFPNKDSQDDHKTPRTLKRVINSAIYVEKPAASISNTNLRLPQKLSSTDLLEIKTKRCTCSVDKLTCRCHSNQLITSLEAEEQTEKPISNVTRSTKKPQTSTKVSQVIKTVETVRREQHSRKSSKKIIEKKKSDDDKLKEELIKQQQENFKKWLLQKKQIELQNKKKKEKEIEVLELKQLEREKKQLENELNFQLWLKKKEEVLLEQKIKKELEGIYDLERKQQQIRDNEKAFREWLQNSKNKQKPVPFNKGVQSLRSATSVTYVNPNPWNTIT